MKKELITIIVAVYNGKRYLEKCIDSLIDQTYKNIEILLIDDGSSDNSSDILDEYLKKDKRIKVIHKKNGGVCSARNCGINNMTGDYFCIVDQDDWLEKDYISYLYNLIKKYKVDISYIPQVIFSTEKNSNYYEFKNESYSHTISGEKAAQNMLNGLIEIGPWNKLIKRDLIIKKDIKFNLDLFGGEGFLFSIDLFMNSKKVAVGYKGLYHYRIDNYSSEMSKFRIRTANSSFKAIEIMKKKYYGISHKIDTSLNFAEWNAYFVFFIKMIACNSIKENKSIFVKWRKKLICSMDSLFKADITFKKKIKFAFVVCFTFTFIFYKKLKKFFIKNNKDRDYDLAE